MTYAITVEAPSPAGHSEQNRPAAELVAGTVVDQRYRLDTMIGEGGMGVVWLATDLALDRPVAVKLIREHLTADAQAITRVLLEARAIAQFRGENVVRVLDVGRLGSGAPYIVMEYLEGNDLFDELADRGPVSVEEAVDLVQQACEGLAEAHAEGIVHRDLKPENLFLAVQPNGSLVLKLIDFGVSKRIHPSTGNERRLTRASTFVGSPQYTAPEQMRGLSDVDQRADIWSLGAILYELLTGVCPFEASTTEAVCMMVMLEHPAPLDTFRPDLPVGLERVVARCLEKDRDRRFASVAELSAALAPFGSARARERAERSERVLSGMRSSRPGPSSAPAASRRASSQFPAISLPHDRQSRATAAAARGRHKPALLLAAAVALGAGALLLSGAAPQSFGASVAAGSKLIEHAAALGSAYLPDRLERASAADDDTTNAVAPLTHTARITQPALPVVLTALAEPEQEQVSSVTVPATARMRPLRRPRLPQMVAAVAALPSAAFPSSDDGSTQ